MGGQSSESFRPACCPDVGDLQVTEHCRLPLPRLQVEPQSLVSKTEEDYWVDAFRTSGFESSIAIYQIKNGKRSLDRASRRATQ